MSGPGRPGVEDDVHDENGEASEHGHCQPRKTALEIDRGAGKARPGNPFPAGSGRDSPGKKYDKRELYLLIEDRTWATAIRCDADDGYKIRQVAQAINVAAKNAAEEVGRPLA
jgi:hypothetical protein